MDFSVYPFHSIGHKYPQDRQYRQQLRRTLMSSTLLPRTNPTQACRPRYSGDNLLEVSLVGRGSSLAMARGASITLSGWRIEPATPRVTMSRNRGGQRSNSGLQGGSWWRKRAFLSSVEGEGTGVALARAEGDRRVATQEQVVMPRENGSSCDGRKGKGFRSPVEAFTLVREGLMRYLCGAR